MKTTFKGQEVIQQRDAQVGDPGFDPTQDQVIIVYDDQHQETVQRSEVGKPIEKMKLPSLPAIAHKKAKSNKKAKPRHR